MDISLYKKEVRGSGAAFIALGELLAHLGANGGHEISLSEQDSYAIIHIEEFLPVYAVANDRHALKRAQEQGVGYEDDFLFEDQNRFYWFFTEPGSGPDAYGPV